MKSTIPDSLIVNSSSHFTSDPFIISPARTLSYREFSGLVKSVLPALKKRYRPGERIAILSANCPEYLILLFAMWGLKIVPVLLNTRWPAQYISRNLKKIKCHQIILSSEFSSMKLKGFTKVHLEDLVVLSDTDTPPIPLPQVKFDLNQDASIIFTSGSTAEPKAVLHTLGNHYYNALGSNQNIRLGPGDRWLLSLPLYHVGGLGIVFRTFLSGAALVIPDPVMSLEKSIRDQKISHLSLVATQLHRLLQDEAHIPYLQKLKTILLGGGPIPHSLLKKCSRLKIPAFVSYGSTEMASQITTTTKKDGLKKWKTAGKVLSHRYIKISPQGEILVKGKTLCKGYIHSGKLKKVTDKIGWFHSGDLGQLDKDGYLTVLGRKDNMFISGGENIQPEEIEEQIRNIAGVEEVVVVPVTDPEFGQRPVAFIKMQEDNKYKTKDKRKKKKYKVQNTKYRLQEMKVYLKRVLPGFKVPDYFLPWPDEAGKGLKISRTEFRKWAAGEIKKKYKIQMTKE